MLYVYSNHMKVGFLSLPTDFKVNHNIFGQINNFDGKKWIVTTDYI